MSSLTSFSVSAGTTTIQSNNNNEIQQQQQYAQNTHNSNNTLETLAGSSPSSFLQPQQQQQVLLNPESSDGDQDFVGFAGATATTTTPPPIFIDTHNLPNTPHSVLTLNNIKSLGHLNVSSASNIPFGNNTFADDSNRSGLNVEVNNVLNQSSGGSGSNTQQVSPQGGVLSHNMHHHHNVLQQHAKQQNEFFLTSNGTNHGHLLDDEDAAGLSGSGPMLSHIQQLQQSNSHLSKIPTPILANIPHADDGTPNVVNGYTVPKLHGNQVFQPLTNLYVSNLSMAVDNDLLFSWFRAFGPLISACVMVDVHTGRSRGYGFVQYESEADGEAALKGLNGKVMPVPRDGNSIILKVQRSMHHKGIPAAPSSTIFLRNIPNTYDSASLLPIMTQYGEVERIQLFSIFENPRLLKACVDFKTQEGALAAVNALHRKLLDPTCEVALAARFADQNRKMHHQVTGNNQQQQQQYPAGSGSGANSPSEMFSSAAASRRESINIGMPGNNNNSFFQNSTNSNVGLNVGANIFTAGLNSNNNSPGGGVRRDSGSTGSGFLMGHPNGLPSFNQQQQQNNNNKNNTNFLPQQQQNPQFQPFGVPQQQQAPQTVWIGGQQVQLVPLQQNQQQPQPAISTASTFAVPPQQQHQQPQFMMVQLQPGQPPVMVAVQQQHQQQPGASFGLPNHQQQNFVLPQQQNNQQQRNFVPLQQNQQNFVPQQNNNNNRGW